MSNKVQEWVQKNGRLRDGNSDIIWELELRAHFFITDIAIRDERAGPTICKGMLEDLRLDLNAKIDQALEEIGCKKNP